MMKTTDSKCCYVAQEGTLLKLC